VSAKWGHIRRQVSYGIAANGGDATLSNQVQHKGLLATPARPSL
jgi:hypothetical protein